MAYTTVSIKIQQRELQIPEYVYNLDFPPWFANALLSVFWYALAVQAIQV